MQWQSIYHDGTIIDESDIANSELIDRLKLKEFRLIQEAKLIFVCFFPKDESRKLIFRRRGMAQIINTVVVFEGLTEENYKEVRATIKSEATVTPKSVLALNQKAENDPVKYHIRYICTTCGSMSPRGANRNCNHDEAGEIPAIFDTENKVAYLQHSYTTTSEQNENMYIVGWHENVRGVSVKSICYIYPDGHVEFDAQRNDFELVPCEIF